MQPPHHSTWLQQKLGTCTRVGLAQLFTKSMGTLLWGPSPLWSLRRRRSEASRKNGASSLAGMRTLRRSIESVFVQSFVQRFCAAPEKFWAAKSHQKGKREAYDEATGRHSVPLCFRSGDGQLLSAGLCLMGSKMGCKANPRGPNPKSTPEYALARLLFRLPPLLSANKALASLS